jgi:hypothetical protein
MGMGQRGEHTHVVTDTGKVSVLEIGIKVDLDDTVRDSSAELILGATRATMEDKEKRLLLARTNLLFRVGLVLTEQLRVQLDVSRLVNTVDVTEARGNRKVGRNRGQRRVDFVDVLGLGVEGVVIHTGVVNAILLTTGNTNLHLEPLLHWCSTLKVFLGDGNVLVLLLLGKINHVRGEEGLAVGLEVGLVGIEHAVQPGKQLLGAVVSVENYGDVVGGGDGSDVVGGGDSTLDGRLLVGVGDTLRKPHIRKCNPGICFVRVVLPFRRSKRHHPAMSAE